MQSFLPPWCSLGNESGYPISLKGLPESGVLKKKKWYAGFMAAEPHSGRIMSHLHLCPWYLEHVFMYAWHECRLNGAGVETGLLIELLACLTVLLRRAPDSLDGVRGCHCRIGSLSKEAALYFYREGRSVLFCTEGAVCVSIDCYNPARS